MQTNYIELGTSRFSRYKQFAYIDTMGFLADRIFIENKVRVKFCGDYKHREKNYIIVICKVKEKDAPMFLQALKELKNRAILMGNTDYETFCKEQIRLMKSKI
nr:MAG TPA: hypothetical protein [Caudoviricetes sp.]